MTEHHPTVVLAIVAGLIGFASYCATAALHVWRSRNRNAGNQSGRSARYGKRVSLLLFAGGAVCLFTALTQHLFQSSEGVLRGDKLAAIRARDGFEVTWLTPNDQVREGEVLLRLSSPDVAAALEVETLKLEELRTEMSILQEGPLTLDPDVARALAQVDNERLHARSHLDENKREQARVVRELGRAKLAAEDQIHRLEVELVELDRELAQAKSVLAYNEGEMRRTDGLRRDGAASTAKYESWVRKTRVSRDEIHKLEASIEKTRQQKSQLEANLHSLAADMKQQSSDFYAQMGAHQTRLAQAEDSGDQLQRKLATEKERAAKIRQHEIEKVRIQSKQVEAEIKKLNESLVVRSPVEGRIVFRTASERACETGDPLLAVAPEDGLQVSLRLPEWQGVPLRTAGEIVLRIDDDEEARGTSDTLFVSRRFTARLVEWQDLEGEASHGLAILRCQPPPQAIEGLMEGDDLRVQLDWQPGIQRHPLFLSGCLFCAASLALAFGLAGTRARRRAGQEELEPIEILIPDSGTHVEDPPGACAAPTEESHDETQLPGGNEDDALSLPSISSRRDTVHDRRDVSLSDTVSNIETVDDVDTSAVRQAVRLGNLSHALRDAILARELDEHVISNMESWLRRDFAAVQRKLRKTLRPVEEIKQAMEELISADSSVEPADGAPAALQQLVRRMCDILGRVEPRLIVFDGADESQGEPDFYMPGRFYGP